MSKIVIKQTRYNIWWKNEGEDFPNLNILKELNDSFVISEYKLNFINQFQAQVKINSSDLDITAFKIESENAFDNQIYVVKSIEKKIGDGILILSLVVDVFSSYGYKVLELPNKFLTKRTHKFNKLSFQMEDNLLNSIPKYYDNNIITGKEYSIDEEQNTPIKVNSKNYGIYPTTFKSSINANIFYVFGRSVNDDTDTTKYTLLPLTEECTVNITNSKNVSLFTDTFYKEEDWERIITRTRNFEAVGYKTTMNLTPEFSPNIPQLEKVINYPYDIASWKPSILLTQYKTRRSDPDFLFWKNWSITRNNIMVKYFSNEIGTNSEKSVWKASGSQSDFLPYPENTDWYYEGYRRLNIEVFGEGATLPYKIKNTSANLSKLVNETSLSKKFIGIFFLPNLSNFTIQSPEEITGLFSGYAAVEISTSGVNIDNFSISSNILLNNQQENKLTWNNDAISSIIFLQYFDLTYYNNSKNWNFYYDYDTSSINLSGKFMFNGRGSVLSNIGIDKTYNNIIEFPYQLPSAQDEYVKYYSGIMSSVNTGIEAQKKNYEISKNQHMGNSITSGIGGAMGLIGNIASGNIGGAIGSATSLGGGIANSIFDRQKLDTSNEMFYKQLGSQFQDVQRTLSTNFSNSADTDLSFIYSNYGTINAEYVQLKNLTKASIININNMIYNYGYQNIGWYDWNELLLYSNFNYVDFENNELIRIVLNELDFKVRNIYEVVINFWNKGRRIWNVKPNKNENILTKEILKNQWKIKK